MVVAVFKPRLNYYDERDIAQWIFVAKASLEGVKKFQDAEFVSGTIKFDVF